MEGNRKLVICGLAILGVMGVAIAGLVVKAGDFATIYNTAVGSITAISGAFVAGNLIETKMKKNGGPAPEIKP